MLAMKPLSITAYLLCACISLSGCGLGSDTKPEWFTQAQVNSESRYIEGERNSAGNFTYLTEFFDYFAYGSQPDDGENASNFQIYHTEIAADGTLVETKHWEIPDKFKRSLTYFSDKENNIYALSTEVSTSTSELSIVYDFLAADSDTSVKHAVTIPWEITYTSPLIDRDYPRISVSSLSNGENVIVYTAPGQRPITVLLYVDAQGSPLRQEILDDCYYVSEDSADGKVLARMVQFTLNATNSYDISIDYKFLDLITLDTTNFFLGSDVVGDDAIAKLIWQKRDDNTSVALTQQIVAGDPNNTQIKISTFDTHGHVASTHNWPQTSLTTDWITNEFSFSAAGNGDVIVTQECSSDVNHSCYTSENAFVNVVAVNAETGESHWQNKIDLPSKLPDSIQFFSGTLRLPSWNNVESYTQKAYTKNGTVWIATTSEFTRPWTESELRTLTNVYSLDENTGIPTSHVSTFRPVANILFTENNEIIIAHQGGYGMPYSKPGVASYQ